MIGLLFFIIAILLIAVIFLAKKVNILNSKISEIEFSYRSMHVKHGKNWEHFAPFMDKFPGNKENFRFIGNPIDGVIFDSDGIKFVEVKTGTSSLSQKQKAIKNLIENKQVSWHELAYRND